MNYLIDTNILIYLLCNPAELSYEAKRILTKEKKIRAFPRSWHFACGRGIFSENIVKFVAFFATSIVKFVAFFAASIVKFVAFF